MGEEAGGRRKSMMERGSLEKRKFQIAHTDLELDDAEISNHVGTTQIWMISDSREAFDKSKPPYGAPN